MAITRNIHQVEGIGRAVVQGDIEVRGVHQAHGDGMDRFEQRVEISAAGKQPADFGQNLELDGALVLVSAGFEQRERGGGLGSGHQHEAGALGRPLRLFEAQPASECAADAQRGIAAQRLLLARIERQFTAT
jgi:hypothetical protein